MIFKRTYKECTDAKIKDLYQKVFDEAKRLYPKHFENTKFYFRMLKSTRILGRCTRSKDIYDEVARRAIANHWITKPSCDHITNEEILILLNENIKSEKQILKTLCHEFGHAVAPSDHHGEIWKARANMIAKSFGLCCERLASEEDATEAGINSIKTPHYKIICEKHGVIATRERHCRLTRYPSQFRCKQCHGDLRVEFASNN